MTSIINYIKEDHPLIDKKRQINSILDFMLQHHKYSGNYKIDTCIKFYNLKMVSYFVTFFTNKNN